MPQPTLIIITGPPGAGKTTLAKLLAERLRLPLICKDSFKELIYDKLGVEVIADEWENKLRTISFALLYHGIETILAAGHSCIAESNFVDRFDTAQFTAIAQRHNAKIIQVFCTAPTPILAKRIKQRVETGERHPVHADLRYLANHENEPLYDQKYKLNLEGQLIEITIEDFSDFKPELVVAEIKSYLP